MAFYRYLLEKDITAFSNKPQQLFNATQKWVRQHIPSANGSLASSTVIHLEGAVEAAKGWNGIYGECYKENVTPQDWKKEIEEYNRLSKGPTTSSAPKLKVSSHTL